VSAAKTVAWLEETKKTKHLSDSKDKNIKI
jgi:hypothetical protein